MQAVFSQPLPTVLDVRNAAVRGAFVSGFLAVVELRRLCELLASERGRAEVSCSFFRDDESRSILLIQVRAELQMVCQRCLDIMTVSVASESELAIIANDDQAQRLPRRLGALVVEGEKCSLWEVVEDELILSLPIVSYHDTASCRQILKDYSDSVEMAQVEKQSPFKVLEQLKTGQEKQEFHNGSTKE